MCPPSLGQMVKFSGRATAVWERRESFFLRHWSSELLELWRARFLGGEAPPELVPC